MPRLIDADVITDWLLQEIRARDGAFSGMLGRQAANMIGKRIDETPTVGEWVSVKDRLPENETDVLAYLNDGEETRIAPCNYSNGVWFDSVMNCVVVFQNVTHWMPLPKRPKEDT